MARALILYATTEGQTARIAERMATVLRERGHSVDTHRAGRGDAGPDPADFDGVIVGAPIHYGRHPGHSCKRRAGEVQHCQEEYLDSADYQQRVGSQVGIALSGIGGSSKISPKSFSILCADS